MIAIRTALRHYMEGETPSQEPRITADDYRALADIAREAQAIGKRDEERRERLGLEEVSYVDEVRPYELSAEAMANRRKKKS